MSDGVRGFGCLSGPEADLTLPWSLPPGPELPVYATGASGRAGGLITCDGRREEMAGGVVAGCIAVAARGRDLGVEMGTEANSGAIL